MNVEETAVEEGDPAKEGGEVGCALGLGLAEAFVEQALEGRAGRTAGSGRRRICSCTILQSGAEVVLVLIEEALLLDEVDEHHAVEHEGGVPVPVALGGDAIDEVPEGGKFRPEAFVEALGDFFYVERLDERGPLRPIMTIFSPGFVVQGKGE